MLHLCEIMRKEMILTADKRFHRSSLLRWCAIVANKHLITNVRWNSLGICTKNLLHEGSCTHFSIQNIEHTRNKMKHDVTPNKWSNMMMFFDVLNTVCFKSQLRRKYNGYTKGLFCFTNQKTTCTKKKTFSHQNTKGNAPKWSQKLKQSFYA